MQKEMVVQSNSMRGRDVQDFVNRVIMEMLKDIAPAFGPGASDYFMMKNGANYYTRDGMEIMESLTFDNEFAKQIHHIMYQAAYRQGKKVGDGTTSMSLFYCLLYMALYSELYNETSGGSDITKNINWVRQEWKKITTELKRRMKALAQPMTEELLLSMLYTCTQDSDLAATIYQKLKGPLMAGAYIIPRKSNIASDFEMTTYNTPMFKATKQFIIQDKNEFDYASILYCNGMLDIVHYETLLALMQKMLAADDGNGNQTPITLNIIILCHGLTQRTRDTLKELSAAIRNYEIDTTQTNNLAIFTLDEYRNFSADELEDVATILTDEPGIGGLVQPLTFETYLYQAFYPKSEDSPDSPPIEDLEQYDVDMHLVTQLQNYFVQVCKAAFDPTEGLKIDKALGPVAQARYNQLRAEIEEEKSEVRKVELNRRLKKSYGMFIDIQVGSALLKDSQRKFELVLDAIVSASTGVREGVIVGNSILHLLRVINEYTHDLEEAAEEKTDEYGAPHIPEMQFLAAIKTALQATMGIMIMNDEGSDFDMKIITEHAGRICEMVDSPDKYKVEHFNLTSSDAVFWPNAQDAETLGLDDVNVLVTLEDGTGVTIKNRVIEPYGIIAEILENSILPVELLKTKVFHTSGIGGYMNNFIE